MKAKEYSKNVLVDQIRLSPYHFRKDTVAPRLEDLADSIRDLGLIHAVSLVEAPEGGLELINGHRRWKAHKLAGLPTIRANIYEYEPDELADEQTRQQAIVQFLLAANSAEPLIPVERARYYAEAMDKFNWTVEHLAAVHNVPVEEIIDDLMYLSVDQRVIDLVAAHPDSFTKESLRVIAENSSLKGKKAWVMTAEEQVQVAEALALQTDKKLVESARALEGHIREIVRKRRADSATEKKRMAGTEDPVKALFRALDATKRSVDAMTHFDIAAVKEIHPKDKGAAYSDLLSMAQVLIDFADTKVQPMKAKAAATAPVAVGV